MEKVKVESYEQGTGVLLYTFKVDVPETEPTLSSHLSQLVAVDVNKVKPAQVRRMWEGREYFYDCFVTETIKDMYVAGNLQVGDWVLVFFDDRSEQVVTEKIYKSW